MGSAKSWLGFGTFYGSATCRTQGVKLENLIKRLLFLPENINLFFPVEVILTEVVTQCIMGYKHEFLLAAHFNKVLKEVPVRGTFS